MKEYKKPIADVLKFSKEDIIQTSSLIFGGEVDDSTSGEGDYTGGGAQGGWGGSKSNILK